MAIIDQAKNHFKGRGRKKIEVPEWGNGDGPCVLFYSPLTLEEQAKIYRATEKSSLAGLAKALVIKCENEKGEKVFKPEDYYALIKGADAKVVARVANTILDVPDSKEMEKNLEATQS